MDLGKLSKSLLNREFPLDFSGNWIANNYVDQQKGQEDCTLINPNNGEKVVSFRSSNSNLSNAIEASFENKDTLANMPFSERIEWLGKFRNALADYKDAAVDALRIESGKPRWEAESDFDAAIRHLDFAVSHGNDIREQVLAPARIASKSGQYSLKPVGVTLAYIPFSTPLTSLVHYMSSTMIAGCAAAMVVPVNAALTGLIATRIIDTIECPQSALNIVFGTYDNLKSVLSDRRIRAIIYTGSAEHCTNIRRESKNIPGRQLILQSGGKNATLIHSSADVSKAVDVSLMGGLKSAGQLCASTSRIFVYENLLEEYCEQLTKKLDSLRIGPTDRNDLEDPFMGPLYSKKALDKFLRYQTMAHRESKRDLSFGKALECESPGFFVKPGIHLMKGFDEKSAIQSNVLVCPDICIYSYDVLDDAIDQINATDSPYAVSFVGDPDKIHSRAEKLNAPNIMVNMPTVETEATLPLSGRQQCGRHRYNGPGIAILLTSPQAIIDGSTDGIPPKWPFG